MASTTPPSDSNGPNEQPIDAEIVDGDDAVTPTPRQEAAHDHVENEGNGGDGNKNGTEDNQSGGGNLGAAFAGIVGVVVVVAGVVYFLNRDEGPGNGEELRRQLMADAQPTAPIEADPLGRTQPGEGAAGSQNPDEQTNVTRRSITAMAEQRQRERAAANSVAGAEGASSSDPQQMAQVTGDPDQVTPASQITTAAQSRSDAGAVTGEQMPAKTASERIQSRLDERAVQSMERDQPAAPEAPGVDLSEADDPQVAPRPSQQPTDTGRAVTQNPAQPLAERAGGSAPTPLVEREQGASDANRDGAQTSAPQRPLGRPSDQSGATPAPSSAAREADRPASSGAQSAFRRVDQNQNADEGETAQNAAPQQNARSAEGNREQNASANVDIDAIRSDVLAEAEEVINTRVQRTEEEVASLRTETNQAQQRISELNEKITSLESRELSAARSSTLLLALSDLSEEIQQGQPFQKQLENVMNIAPDDVDLSSLNEYAQNGLPTTQELERRYQDAARRALAGTQKDEADDTFSRFVANLQGLFTVRRVGEIPGQTPDAIIARAEADLNNNQLADAVEELRGLDGSARTAFDAWIEDASAKVNAEERIDSLERKLITGEG